MVLRETGGAVAAGLALGLPAAFVVSRSISSQLFGVSVVDPMTGVAAVGLMTAIAAVSAFIPAHRIARIDPASAMRCE